MDKKTPLALFDECMVNLIKVRQAARDEWAIAWELTKDKDKARAAMLIDGGISAAWDALVQVRSQMLINGTYNNEVK